MNSDSNLVLAVTFGQPTNDWQAPSIPPRSFRNFTLLADATLTSQQVPITLNKLSDRAGNQSCLRLFAMLSTLCSANEPRRTTKVIGAEKEKNETGVF